MQEQQKNLLLVLVGAVVFAFLMGMLGNLVVNHFMFATSRMGTVLAFTLPILAAFVFLIYYIIAMFLSPILGLGKKR